MVVNKCCCCAGLRTGCIIISVLQILEGWGIFCSLEWFTIITGIITTVAGAFLLFGAIKYNRIGVLINLILTPISMLLVFIVAILFVVEASLGLVILGTIYLLTVVIEIYLWLCILSFYKKLKSVDTIIQ